MMKAYISFTGIIMAMMVACKTKPQEKTALEAPCVPVANTSTLEGKPTADFSSILTVLVNGDKLNMQVEYVGCGNEPVFLAWSGAFMKSLPPKVSVKPGFIRSDKLCGAQIRRELCFDISALREHNRKQGLVILTDGFDKPVNIPAEK